MRDNEIEHLNWNGWPLPDACLIELGRINDLWSSLESFLNMCLSKLAGFENYSEVPFIMINHASFPQRLEMLGAFCEHLKDDYPNLADHKVVIGKLKSAQKLRNDFIHNGLYFDPDRKKFSFSKGSARGVIKTVVEDIKIADIRKASMAIEEAVRALHELVLGK